jgi:hypothetical protein
MNNAGTTARQRPAAPLLRLSILVLIGCLLVLSSSCSSGYHEAETIPTATPEPVVEHRVIELEYPRQIRMGDSDVIRLSLLPVVDGYAVTAEFPEHTVEGQEVEVEHYAGYELVAGARLDGISFEFSPTGEQRKRLPINQKVEWRWSLTPQRTGHQRISIELVFYWVPIADNAGREQEALVYSRSLGIDSVSFLGLQRTQAAWMGVVGLFFGSGLGLFALRSKRAERLKFDQPSPNLELDIETPRDTRLDVSEALIFRSLFQSYQRIIIQDEFLSGYSGARTFLVLPIHAEGRMDAYTIAKISQRETIEREYRNYESYVKHSLPPVTARIQHAPIVTKDASRAGMLYTFIAEPGQSARSLRAALLDNPDPTLLWKLFELFGPNWWMQRKPHVFPAAREYDRLLPPHLVLEQDDGKPGKTISAEILPGALDLEVGDIVRIKSFKTTETRLDDKSLNLLGDGLRLRWLDGVPPRNTTAKVIETRASMLSKLTEDMDRFDLPDPLSDLSRHLSTTIQGTRSIIHGDLNLENILVGPGNLVWLIDFAETREGHTLFDFARLYSELVAHVIAPRSVTPDDFLRDMRSGIPLLQAVEEIAEKLLFNNYQPREFYLACYFACLGALKFTNLNANAKHCLYLAAAFLSRQLNS